MLGKSSPAPAPLRDVALTDVLLQSSPFPLPFLRLPVLTPVSLFFRFALRTACPHDETHTPLPLCGDEVDGYCRSAGRCSSRSANEQFLQQGAGCEGRAESFHVSGGDDFSGKADRKL